MIIPRIQEEKYTGGALSLPRTIRVFAADALGEKAFGLFRYFIPTVSFILTDSRSSADIVFSASYALPDKAECYRISAEALPVTVQYRDYAGARNAVSTISQQLVKAEGGYAYPACTIFDYPDFRMRSVMLDPARGLIPVMRVEEILIRMAMAKYNYLHLHLSDDKGYAISSDVVPLSGPNGRQYTKDEIRHIVAFASLMGIECIPEVEFPAHGFQLLTEMPELKCVTDGTEEPSPWAVCAGNEKTYEVLEKLYTELASLFPGKIIHVGTDEIEMNDLTELRTWPTWHCCSRCRELCEREHIDQSSRTEIFYYMLRRVYKIITGLGKRLMMWNDNIDISKTPELPRDILIHFWRVAGKNRGPVEGCSMERFLEEGFEVFNSYYPETYIERDFYKNNDETILVWTPHGEPQHDPRYDSQILGGEPCAWGDAGGDGHFNWTLPTSIMLFGDRLWNRGVCDDRKAFGIAGTRYQLGIDTPEGFDIFGPFGGFMQPRSIDGTRMWADKAAEDLSETDSVLKTLQNDYTMSGRLAGVYRESIAWLKAKRAEK